VFEVEVDQAVAQVVAEVVAEVAEEVEVVEEAEVVETHSLLYVLQFTNSPPKDKQLTRI
jgi:hypothetical protein